MSDAARTAEEAVDVPIELIEGRPAAERMRLIPTRLALGQSTNRTPSPRDSNDEHTND